jgi:hypothetical protein
MSKIAPLTYTSDQSSSAMAEVVDHLLQFGRFDIATNFFLESAMHLFGTDSTQYNSYKNFYLPLFKLHNLNHAEEWSIDFINEHIHKPLCLLQDLYTNDDDRTAKLYWQPIRKLVFWQVRGDHIFAV